jgi:hypothetical protein
MKEDRRLFSRSRAGEFALDRENVFAEPRQELAFAPSYRGILRQVRVAVNRTPARSEFAGS